MAVCAYIDANGNVIYDSTPPASCTTYLLMDSADYTAFQNLQTGDAQSITFQDVFAIPESEVLGQAFWYGFSLVILCYLVAYGYGVVINFFKPSHDRY